MPTSHTNQTIATPQASTNRATNQQRVLTNNLSETELELLAKKVYRLIRDEIRLALERQDRKSVV